MREPQARACAATARQLRRQAAKVVTAPAIVHNVLPFGEGNTNAVPAGIDCKDGGERE
jgi:fido (protein-threonine AMPylation protein)